MRDIRETIDHLLRLSERPGTEQEGINAYERALLLCEKHGISISDFRRRPTERPRTNYSRPSYKPKPKPAEPKPETEKRLRREVQAFEEVLLKDGWRFVSQTNGMRNYRSRYSLSHEMHIIVDFAGRFFCNHVYTVTGTIRRQSPSPADLVRYFNTYEYMIETTPHRPAGNVVVESLDREVNSGGFTSEAESA
jgi:hypothetical protein